jgi:hypothetical protein
MPAPVSVVNRKFGSTSTILAEEEDWGNDLTTSIGEVVESSSNRGEAPSNQFFEKLKSFLLCSYQYQKESEEAFDWSRNFPFEINTDIVPVELEYRPHSYEKLGRTFSNLWPFLTRSEREIESPFIELDEKVQKRLFLKNIIETFRKNTNLSYRDKLSNRLGLLLEEEQNTFPDSWEFSRESLMNFLDFFDTHQSLAYPDVTLSVDGLLTAEWYKSFSKHLILEFEGARKVNFVLINKKYKKNAVDINGELSMSLIWDTILLYDADEWCKNE